MKDYHRKNMAFFATLPGNVKVSLPRIYRDKFFTEREKEDHRLESEAEMEKADLEKLDILTKRGEDINSYFYQARQQALDRISRKSKEHKL